MVRNKTGIENYVNIIGVGISMVIIMPFKNKEFLKYEFKSPQEIKSSFGDRIKEKLILNNLLKTLKLNKNNIAIKDIIGYLTWIDSASWILVERCISNLYRYFFIIMFKVLINNILKITLC